MLKKVVTSGVVLVTAFAGLAGAEKAAAAPAAPAKQQPQQVAVSQENVEQLHAQAVEMARAGKMNQSVVLLRELTQRPDATEAVWHDYLTVLQWAGNNRATIEIFQQRYGGKEEAVPGYLLRSIGGAYYQLEQFEKAQYYYGLAVKKGETAVRLQQAEAAMRAGDTATGEALYAALLQERPNDMELYLSRSAMGLYRKNFAQSQADYDKALELLAAADPVGAQKQRQTLDASRAAVLIRTEELQQAITMLRPYMEPGKATRQMECDYILALRLRGDYKQTIAEAHRLWPDLGDVPSYGLQALGDSHLRLRQYEKANNVYGVLLQREPTRVAAQVGQAYAQVAQGHVGEGVALYREAYRQDKTVGTIIAADASNFFSIGRYEAGKALYGLLLELEPGKSSSYREYGNNLRESEMPREAYDIYHRMAQLSDGEVYGLAGKVKAAVDAGDYQSAQKSLDTLRERYAQHVLTADAAKAYDERQRGNATVGARLFSDYKGNNNLIFDHSGSQSLSGNWSVLWGLESNRMKEEDPGLTTIDTVKTMKAGVGYTDRWWSARAWASDFRGEGRSYSGAQGDVTFYLGDFTKLSLAVGNQPIWDPNAWENGQIHESYRTVTFDRRIGPQDTYKLGYTWSDYSDNNKYQNIEVYYNHNFYTHEEKSLDGFFYASRGHWDFESALYESPDARIAYGGGFIQRWEIPAGYWEVTSGLGLDYDNPGSKDLAAFARVEYGHTFSPRHSFVLGGEYGLRSDHHTRGHDILFGYRQFDLRYNIIW